MSAEIDMLRDFLASDFPCEQGPHEPAVDCAIRLLRRYRQTYHDTKPFTKRVISDQWCKRCQGMENVPHTCLEIG